MRLTLLHEGYGRVNRFRYDNWQVDPKPQILVLGRWRHPRTRNNLVAGINLNYLNDFDLANLRKKLPMILQQRRLKDRYWAGRRALPDLFSKNYRTYNAADIGVVEPGTLRFWTTKAGEAGSIDAPGRVSD